MSFFFAMYYFVSGHDQLLVSFLAESTTLLSADIRLRPNAIRHFQLFFRFRLKVEFFTFGQPLMLNVHVCHAKHCMCFYS